MKQNQVTIKDIARILGISASTVSRALNDHPDINANTKKEVNELAKELHYEPNAIAQNLRSKKTNTIGVIVPEIVHFFFSTIISGIEEVAYDAGYTVMFCQSGESYEREVKDTKALLNHRIDGLLLSYSKETTNFDHFKEIQERIPIVLFDRVTDQLNVSKIRVDDLNGAYEATKHLIDQNCQRIAHLAAPQNLTIGAERKQGYEKALTENNLSIESEYIIPCFSGTLNEGYYCMKRLLELDNPPDGVFAHNDTVAFGCMKAIKEMGLNMPNDIAIIGFSNWQFASLIEPQLSTIDQPGKEMGRVAAKRLIDELQNDELHSQPKTQVLKTKLIVRESSLRK